MRQYDDCFGSSCGGMQISVSPFPLRKLQHNTLDAASLALVAQYFTAVRERCRRQALPAPCHSALLQITFFGNSRGCLYSLPQNLPDPTQFDDMPSLQGRYPRQVCPGQRPGRTGGQDFLECPPENIKGTLDVPRKPSRSLVAGKDGCPSNP